jgi:uncharacterized membrane protein
MVLFSVVFLLFPPRKINHLYGYRTFKSMKSQQAWDFANSFFARYLLVASLAVCVLQAVLLLVLPARQVLSVSTAGLVVALFAGLFITEYKLKRRGF